MLARYLRTSQQPVRYAMHPDLAQALSNYLMIHSRAHNLPGLHEQAGHALGLYGHPQLQHLMQGILHGHHETPGMYLDQLQELVPGLHPPERHQIGTDPVRDLLRHLDEYGEEVRHPVRIGTGYGQRALQHPSTIDLLTMGWAGALEGQEYSPGAHIYELREHPSTPHDLRGYLQGLRDLSPASGSTRRVLTAHDLANEAARRGEGGGHAGHAVSGIQQLLREHLMPHLDTLNMRTHI